MGSWIESAQVTDAGIVFPGEKLWRKTHDDLILDPEGATIRRGDRLVCLGWGSYETRQLKPTTWRFIHNWAAVEAGTAVSGVAISSGDELAERMGSLRAGTSKPMAMVAFSRTEESEIVETLDAMATLLAERPDCRGVFTSRYRSEQVLRMLWFEALRSPDTLPGSFWSVRRVDKEIMLAAKRAGLEHPLRGRPLPGDVRIQEPEAHQMLRHALASGEYSHNVEIDDNQIARYLAARYYVAPWPFQVLLSRPVDD